MLCSDGWDTPFVRPAVLWRWARSAGGDASTRHSRRRSPRPRRRRRRSPLRGCADRDAPGPPGPPGPPGRPRRRSRATPSPRTSIHPPGLAALDRWGMLEPAIVDDRCRTINTYSFDLGPLTIAGPRPGTGSRGSYAPRRTILDKILVDAAAASGAEVREGFTVDELVTDGADDAVTGIRGHEHGRRPQVTSTPGWCRRGRTSTPSSPGPSGAVAYAEKPKMQRLATTPTGPGCPCSGLRGIYRGPTVRSRPGPPTTA